MEQSADHDFVVDIDQKLHDLSPIPPERSIFRVHDALRNINVKAYEPQLIAIGPYHQANNEEKSHLRPMEVHKLLYLRQLLGRRNETSAQRYIEAMQQSEERARKFYAEHIDLSSDEFVKIMLLDGCFIIEFLRKNIAYNDPILQSSHICHGIDKDPIFQSSHIFNGLRRDLQLLENQLPLFVLMQLFDMTKEEEEYLKNINIPVLALYYFENIVQPAGQGTKIKIFEEHSHLLSLVHACCCYPFKELLTQTNNNVQGPPHLLSQVHSCCCYPFKELLSQTNNNDGGQEVKNKAYIESPTKLMEAEAGEVNNNTFIIELPTKPMEAGKVKNKLLIESATKLMEAGIKFTKAEGRSLFDITFQNGTMKIPTLVVDDDTDCLFRNYIAYEQYVGYDYPQYFTNYMQFVVCLITSSEDVEILRHLGIVDNHLGDDEVVSSMVKKLGDNVTVDFHSFYECYSKVFNDVNKHCNRRINKWMAQKRRDYFKSPWASISSAIVFLMLLLTVTQTVFSILSVV